MHGKSDHKEVARRVEREKDRYIDTQEAKIETEAVEALNMVLDVIEALQSKRKDVALDTIEKALGKLELLLARDPDLQLVPVDVKEKIVDYPGTIDDIAVVKRVLKDLIDTGEVQTARDIMLGLASELGIYITALPIGTYPVALKAIIPLIEEEKYDDATKLLVEALETLVIEKIVIPLPILRAEQAIEHASELTREKENANKEELKELTAYAKEQLLLAQALGYGKVDEDYKPLLEEIKKIEKILQSEESTKNIFEELKTKLGSFMKDFNHKKEPTQMPKA